MEVASHLNLVIHKQHAMFLARETPIALSARILNLLDLQQQIVPIHFEVRSRLTCGQLIDYSGTIIGERGVD